MKQIGCLHDIHGLSLRETFLDIDKYYFVGYITCNQYICTGGTYITGTYYSYL